MTSVCAPEQTTCLKACITGFGCAINGNNVYFALSAELQVVIGVQLAKLTDWLQESSSEHLGSLLKSQQHLMSSLPGMVLLLCILLPSVEGSSQLSVGHPCRHLLHCLLGTPHLQSVI